jgi:hypothetical protein
MSKTVCVRGIHVRHCMGLYYVWSPATGGESRLHAMHWGVKGGTQLRVFESKYLGPRGMRMEKASQWATS